MNQRIIRLKQQCKNTTRNKQIVWLFVVKVVSCRILLGVIKKGKKFNLFKLKNEVLFECILLLLK